MGATPVMLVAAVGLAVAVGLGLGLLLTAAVTRTDAIGTKLIGPWRIFADAGSQTANPYGRARLARTGEIPLAAAQGVTIVARSDDAGAALDGRCTYRVSGPVPPARLWSLEAASTTGLPFANPAERQAFTSADVLRDAAGRSVITLSPAVQAGNWLPLPGVGHVALVLRLYETGVTVIGTSEGAGSLPSITRIGCAP